MSKKIFLTFAVCLIAFFLKAFFFVDPDFGWHLKTGEIIAASGIPRYDPFSYSMPSFQVVGNSWLADFLMAKAFPVIGVSGLAIFFSLMAVLSLFVPSKTLKEEENWPAEVFLATSALLPFFSIRPLVFSWLFFSILIFLLRSDKIPSRARFLIPGLFVIWANFHAGFLLGLGVLAVFHLAKWFRLRKIDPMEIVLVLLSISGTLVNPYGLRIWTDSLQTIGGVAFKGQVSEWGLTIDHFEPAFTTLLVLSLFTVIVLRRIIAPAILACFILLLVAGMGVVRNVPFLIIFSLPMVRLGWKQLRQAVSKKDLGEERFLRVRGFFFLASIFAFLIFSSVSIRNGKEFAERFYPTGAISFIKTEIPRGNLLSIYDWGGFLIWKLPEKKVFVDGRMPFWKQSERESESQNAFEEISKLDKGEIKAEEFFRKYNVTMILWPNPEGTFKSRKERKSFDLIDDLKSKEWKKIYEDQTSVVFRRLEN